MKWIGLLVLNLRKRRGFCLALVSLLALLALANAARAASSVFMINEVKFNPPGSFPTHPDSLWEYIELIGPSGYDLTSHRVVVIGGSKAGSIGRGVATLVVPLSGTIPASGIVLIKQAGHPTPPGALGITVTAGQRIAAGVDNDQDDLIRNHAYDLPA